MLSTAHRRSGTSGFAKVALAGLCALGFAGLQACVAPSGMPSPKYPIYMQDKPAEAVQTIAEAEAPPAPAAASVPSGLATINAPGAVTTAELAPPPPPPPPAGMSSAAPKDGGATPAAPPVTAPVRDTGAAYVYVLEAGDTLYGVSRRFGVPVKVLYDINALPQESTLRIGQKILLPASAVDKGSEEHAHGVGMTKLGSSVAVVAPPPAPKPVVTQPAKPEPAKPEPAKPVVAKPEPAPVKVSKPVVTAPVTATPPVAPPAAKPTVTPPAPKPVAVPPSNGAFPSSTQIAQMGRGLFAWPVKGKILVPYGQLAPNVRNDGINISADMGADVFAAADGVVVYEGDQVKELGNTIYVKHPGGWYTGYSHLGAMKVKNNEKVTKGQLIGSVGQTGVIDRPQLHFEIRYTPSTDIAKPIDPNLVLP